MATTTNFGWETPDDTDLVKDGALAIRTLGSAIDTSLVDLKGGTTGQVLSKTSNTDMDFTWVTSDDANAIQNAIVDAKGDLIAASAADTPARLAVGNNGETLVADSSTSVGLLWNPPVASLSNPIINGGMDIWQRGTSFTAATVYTADRWIKDGQTTRTVSRELTGDTTNLPNIQYCARIARNNGDSSTAATGIYSTLETSNSFPYIGKQITLSFYARKGASFTGSFNTRFMTGTGTDQLASFGSSMTGQVNTDKSHTLTTTWQRFVQVVTVPTTATQIAVGFRHAPTGTASDTNDYTEITGVQIDVGNWTASTAPTFRRSGNTLAGELAACKRYLPSVLVGSGNSLTGYATATTNSYVGAQFDVQARVAPTGLTVSGTSYTLYAGGGGSGTPTAIAFDSAGVNSALIQVTTTAGSPTLAANNAVALRSTAAASQILFTGCEL